MFGIDTIQIMNKDFEIKGNNEIIRQPKIYKNEIINEKKFYNDNQINLDIKNFGKEKGDILFIKFSIPKIYNNGINYEPLNIEQEKETLKYVIKQKLKEIGILASENFTITRIDIFRNIELNEPYIQYEGILETLNFSRKKLYEFGNTIKTMTFKNTQEQICFYDKINEMLERKINICSFPSNVARVENRILNNSKIENIFGFKSLKYLHNNYEVLGGHYRDIMRNAFKYEPKEFLLLSENTMKNTLLYLTKIKGFGIKTIQNFLNLQIGKEINLKLVLQIFKQIINESFENKIKGNVYFTRVREFINEIERERKILKIENNLNSVELYKELKFKLVA